MTESGYAAPKAMTAGRGWTIASFVFAGLALIVVPLLMGIVGVVLGVVAWRRGDPLARWAIAASVAGAVLGTFIGVAVLNAVDS